MTKSIVFRKKLQNVQDIDEEDYCPNGTTALYDAIGITLDDFIWESDEDSKTLVFIITAGMENASYRYTLKDIKKKIVKLQKDHHWEFIFMGANIDAYGVAGSIGIGKKRTVNYQNDDRGIKLNYEVMSDVAAKFIKNQEIDDDWHESIDQDFKSRR